MQHDWVTLLENGRVWRGTGGQASEPDEAVAIGGGTVLALGTGPALRDRFPQAKRLDLGGRAVIPGLIDGHSHAVRGGATWNRELHWAHLTSREQALASIREAALAAPPGSWVTAIGGWHQSQFSGWLPTRLELDAAAAGHPVYVQSLYEVGIANSAAMDAVQLAAAIGSLPSGTIVTDADGVPTGVVTGLAAYTLFVNAAGFPSLAEQEAGTRSMVHDFASLGITGLCDAGGFGMGADKYAAVDALAARSELNLRMRLFLSATTVGREAEQVGDWLRDPRLTRADDWLRVLGIGEVVHFGCHDFEGLDDFSILPEALAEFTEISAAVAEAGLPMHVHAVMDESIGAILDSWELVNRHTPIAGLRFSLAHGDRISPRNIDRAIALGLGVIVDARQTFRSEASQEIWGNEPMHAVPPLGDILERRMPLGVGSDATRASSHNPWLSLWWLVAGRPLDGCSQRDERHLLSREAALAAHTNGSAWFSSEEKTRGRIEPGWRSDLAVLNADYFSVDIDEIPTLRSELTLVGNRVSYSSGAIAAETVAS